MNHYNPKTAKPSLLAPPDPRSFEQRFAQNKLGTFYAMVKRTRTDVDIDPRLLSVLLFLAELLHLPNKEKLNRIHALLPGNSSSWDQCWVFFAFQQWPLSTTLWLYLEPEAGKHFCVLS